MRTFRKIQFYVKFFNSFLNTLSTTATDRQRTVVTCAFCSHYLVAILFFQLFVPTGMDVLMLISVFCDLMIEAITDAGQYFKSGVFGKIVNATVTKTFSTSIQLGCSGACAANGFQAYSFNDAENLCDIYKLDICQTLNVTPAANWKLAYLDIGMTNKSKFLQKI